MLLVLMLVRFLLMLLVLMLLVLNKKEKIFPLEIYIWEHFEDECKFHREELVSCCLIIQVLRTVTGGHAFDKYLNLRFLQK